MFFGSGAAGPGDRNTQPGLIREAMYDILRTPGSTACNRERGHAMKRFFRSFRQLRWKLTLSYTLTSVVAFMLAVMLIFGSLLLFFGTHISTIILNTLDQQAVQAAPYLARASANADLLAAWLQITSDNDASQNANNDPFHYSPIFLAATNAQGRVLASAGSQPLPRGILIQTALTPQNAAQLSTVLSDTRSKTSTIGPDSGDTLVAIS